MIEDAEKEMLLEKDRLNDINRELSKEFIDTLKITNKYLDKTNLRMMIIIISLFFALIVISISHDLAYYKLQKSVIDYMNQYEYSTEVKEYTITQDAQSGENNAIIGKDGTIKWNLWPDYFLQL